MSVQGVELPLAPPSLSPSSSSDEEESGWGVSLICCRNSADRLRPVVLSRLRLCSPGSSHLRHPPPNRGTGGRVSYMTAVGKVWSLRLEFHESKSTRKESVETRARTHKPASSVDGFDPCFSCALDPSGDATDVPQEMGRHPEVAIVSAGKTNVYGNELSNSKKC